MMVIIKALLLMLILGAVLGAVLGFASKKFYVKEDNRVQDILGMLPGYNCGGCGNPGCAGMAAKLVSGDCKIDQCAPSKPDAKEKIRQYLAEHKEA
ncbi:MAG: electron transporter RnfB [Erysipelotrichaceae bacterium]|jgi:electron transport complex protein RnfB|nr:electron transporter RnfB [Erysipelotrichaceae bacterium]